MRIPNLVASAPEPKTSNFMDQLIFRFSISNVILIASDLPVSEVDPKLVHILLF